MSYGSSLGSQKKVAPITGALWFAKAVVIFLHNRYGQSFGINGLVFLCFNENKNKNTLGEWLAFFAA